MKVVISARPGAADVPADRVSFDDVRLQGIERISIDDIRRAGDMGFRIKLLGVAQMTGRGLEQRMSPCLVPADSPLGQLQGGTNMVVIEGDSVGQIVMRGPGAGEGEKRAQGEPRRTHLQGPRGAGADHDDIVGVINEFVVAHAPKPILRIA